MGHEQKSAKTFDSYLSQGPFLYFVNLFVELPAMKHPEC